MSWERIRLDPSRTFDTKNPKHWQFQLAEFHLKNKMMDMAQMMAQAMAQANRGAAALASVIGQAANKNIDFIDYIDNKRLQAKFDAKKKDFSRRRIPDGQIYAFHATLPSNIDSILRDNLNYSKTAHGRVHGDGCYFSEFPDFSLRYGQGLILFEVLPGKEYLGLELRVPHGFNCKKVDANAEGRGQQLIITDTDQFIPRYVYHWK
jgi:hypothetical protein